MKQRDQGASWNQIKQLVSLKKRLIYPLGDVGQSRLHLYDQSKRILVSQQLTANADTKKKKTNQKNLTQKNNG